jgi:hypothetical protein
MKSTQFVFDISERSETYGSIEASGNYWGENITAEMNSKGAGANISAFHDYYDDFDLVKINYDGWVAEKIVESGPGW